MDFIKTTLQSYPLFFLGILLIILIDCFTAFRYYYIKKFFFKEIQESEKKELEYLQDIVKSAYGTLASEEAIEEALSALREKEKELGVDPYDFSEEEALYKKQVKDVLDRGYF